MKKSFMLAPLLVSSSLVMAADYCNTRFDYCIDVPSQWLPEAESGDGRHFKLANSQ